MQSNNFEAMSLGKRGISLIAVVFLVIALAALFLLERQEGAGSVLVGGSAGLRKELSRWVGGGRTQRQHAVEAMPVEAHVINLNTKDPEIVKATRRLLIDLNRIEVKNSRVIHEIQNDQIGLEAISVAISAPSTDDIAAISQSITAVMQEVPPNRQAEVQDYLWWYYTEYTQYLAKYRVVTAEFRKDSKTSTLDISNFDDPNEAIPDENGIVRSSKPSQSYFNDDNPTSGWRRRYGHLFDVDSDSTTPPQTSVSGK